MSVRWFVLFVFGMAFLLLRAGTATGPWGATRVQAAEPGPRLRPAQAAPPPGLQCSPAVAESDGLLYVTWSDTRDGGADRLYWTRLTRPVPDTLAVPVTEGGASELRPAVAAGPGWALVTWEAWSDGAASLRGAELFPSGVPATVPTWAVTAGEGQVWRPAAAVRGDLGVLVWEDERDAPGDVYFCRWDRGFGPREPGGIPLAVGADDQRWPRVAASPGGFAAVWAEGQTGIGYRVRMQVLDEDGGPVGVPRVVSGLCASAPAADVVWTGEGWFVAWRCDGEGGGDLAGRFADSTGVPLGEGPIPLVTSPALEFRPRLGAGDCGLVLVWEEQGAEGRALRRALVDVEGTVTPPAGVILAPPEDFAADGDASGWGEDAAAVWRVPSPGDDDDLFLAAFAPTDTTETEPIPLTVAEEGGIAAVGDGSGAAVELRAVPNPFRGSVSLFPAGRIRAGVVEIFDLAGRRIRRVEPGGAGVGWRWDGKTERGKTAPPGLYYARRAGDGKGVRLVKLP